MVADRRWKYLYSESGRVEETLAQNGLAVLTCVVCLVAIAARRLRMATVGFMQFLAPSLQFLIGYLYGETLTLPHLLCFLFIWAAVIAFSTDALTNSRRIRVA